MQFHVPHIVAPVSTDIVHIALGKILDGVSVVTDKPLEVLALFDVVLERQLVAQDSLDLCKVLGRVGHTINNAFD